MNRILSLSAIILSSIGISAMEPEHTMLPDASYESYNDTIWLDHYENKEVHLQRFNDTDTLVALSGTESRLTHLPAQPSKQDISSREISVCLLSPENI